MTVMVAAIDSNQVLAKDEAATDAQRLLATVWDGELPIDPVRIARQLGILVLDAQLDDNVSGALVKEIGHDPTILLNASDSPNRKRFTCAHELGHFVRRPDNPDSYEYVDLRNSLSATGLSLEEVYANNFAACLLMPEEDVKRLWNEGLREPELVVRFDVSQDAMHYRLANLGLAK